MKKLFLLTMAALMTVSAMAIGTGDGSNKANAKEFDWDKGITVPADSLNRWRWYRVDLAPLYEEDNPSLTLYLTNPSNVVGNSVDVKMTAEIAGEGVSKDYTIAARQYKTYTANAAALVRLRQKELYLQMYVTGVVKLSAKVYETEDLDESCKDARELKWDTPIQQDPTYSAWWKVSLKPIKNATDQDAKITITNVGTKRVNLKVGQSLDCPSSGMTRREYDMAPGEVLVDTIPRAMINSVQPDELYFGIENVESPVTIKVEKVKQPTNPVIPETMSYTDLHVESSTPIAAGTTTLYRLDVKKMRDTAKYEPEFTYRNVGTIPVKVTVKMAFQVPAYGTSNAEYELAPGQEEVVVYKKNMLDGLGDDVKYIYLLTTVQGDSIRLNGRFKHVREGKACKTNIDFNWHEGHKQEARTTQWYAVDVTEARDNFMDIEVNLMNLGESSATVKAMMAFSCPYIDVQEMTRTIAAKSTPSTRRISYSTYAMLSDTIWIGLETSQDIRFWADTIPAKKKPATEVSCVLETAAEFDWTNGVRQKKDTTVWYKIDMQKVKKLSAKFPTVFVQNLSSDAAAKITAELSLACPDTLKNEQRSITIAANGSYSKQISRNMFENISEPEVYLKVTSTQEIHVQIRLTEEEAGTSCSSAIPFNWVSGHSQAANANLWYSVDLRDVMKRGNDLVLHLLNKDNAKSKGVIQIAYSCPINEAPSVKDFSLAAKDEKKVTVRNSTFETLTDSIVFLNLQGTTALRFWADTLAVQPFDTIKADGITLIPLQWDVDYTQTTDTAWYIIPKSEIDTVRNMTEKQKPVAHVTNLGTTATTVKAEVAYAFPIGKQMMSKSQNLRAGQHFSDTIPASTFEQILKKDSIILRVTRKPGSGNFTFKAELVKAFTGNSRYDALPLEMGKTYTQAPKTFAWYKLNTADLKKDKTLYGKSLNVMAKNAGKGNAKVDIEIYEGLLSETELIEYYTTKHASRTIKKGESRSHNIPAQIVYAVDSVEFYIKVTTTDSLVASSSFSNYVAADVDSAQLKAKLVVPNVEYYLPKDTAMWFVACAQYVHYNNLEGKLVKNFIYTDGSTLEYELENNAPATVEVTATLQDTLTYKVPVRTRTINRSGTARKGEKPLKDLLNKALDKASSKIGGRKIDISSFEDAFIDSLLHRYVTKEHVAVYFRVKTDNPVKLRLNTPQLTGDKCLNPMRFDWHHGNVNPAKDTTWIHVQLDSTMVPQGKDLLLHMDNWSTGATDVKAVILEEDCSGKELGSVSRKVTTDTIKVIERKLLQTWGWGGFQIKYYSDSTTYLWAEIVDAIIPDTLYDTIRMNVCMPYTFTDVADTIRTINQDSTWTVYTDSIDKAKVEYHIIQTYYDVKQLKDPKLIKIDSLTNIPVVTKGAVLDCSAATTELYNKFLAAADSTIKAIEGTDSIKWEYVFGPKPTGEPDWQDIPATPLDTAVIALRYNVITECGDTLTSDVYLNTPFFVNQVTACTSYTWDLNPGTDYTKTCKDTVAVNVYAIDATTVLTKNMVLDLTINLPLKADTTHADIAHNDTIWNDTYHWAINDSTYKETPSYMGTTMGEDQFVVPGRNGECDTVYVLKLVIAYKGQGCSDTVTVDTTLCKASFTWIDGKTYTTNQTGVEYKKPGGGAVCDSVFYLNLTLTPVVPTAVKELACDTFRWRGNLYDTTGKYYDTIPTASGLCDSILTLDLTIAKSYKDTVKPALSACNIVTYNWGDSVKSYNQSGYYTRVFKTVNGCDSSVTINVDIKVPAVFKLPAVAKYGNRLLMINRLAIQDSTGWNLAELEANQISTEVEWYRMETLTDPNPKKVTEEEGAKGYYITNGKNPGEPLVGVYFAKIEIPAVSATACPQMGYTELLDCTKPANAAPMLIPNLARPGESIRVVNLNPEQETTIRVYTTEGLVREAYTVSGEESFVIKAAVEHGFYLVELRNEDLHSTLRYIVK